MANKYECLRFGYLRMSSIKKQKTGEGGHFLKLVVPPITQIWHNKRIGNGWYMLVPQGRIIDLTHYHKPSWHL